MRDRLPRFTDRCVVAGAFEVSPLCLGLVDDPAVVTAAYDAGLNFFFVSTDLHWPAYAPLREGLAELLARGVRDRIVVAAACYMTQPEFCTQPFRELLAAIPGLGRVDIAIAGGGYGSELLRRLPVYERHRRDRFAGIRAIGTSFHDRAAALVAIERGLVDLAFVRYNPSHPGARDDLFPHLSASRDTRVFGFKSTWGAPTARRLETLGLSATHWRPAIADYYRFALSEPSLDGLLFSVRDRAQLDALGDALERGPLDDDEQTYLLELALIADAS